MVINESIISDGILDGKCIIFTRSRLNFSGCENRTVSCDVYLFSPRMESEIQCGVLINKHGVLHSELHWSITLHLNYSHPPGDYSDYQIAPHLKWKLIEEEDWRVLIRPVTFVEPWMLGEFCRILQFQTWIDCEGTKARYVTSYHLTGFPERCWFSVGFFFLNNNTDNPIIGHTIFATGNFQFIIYLL